MQTPSENHPAPGVPEALHAPWRLEYLEAIDSSPKSAASASGSFLEKYWASPSEDGANHVIVRTSHGMILLNMYPYANGHLLVALGDARPTLLDYSQEQRARLWQLTDVAADLMQTCLEPQGINVGVNQGRAAGAGVPQHLHVHLVPRWGGDVNFMTTVGAVRVIPASLGSVARRYRATWAHIRGRWVSK